MLAHHALPADRAVVLVVLAHPHHIKVVARQVHDAAPAVRESAEGEPVLLVLELVVVEVEHALLALSALPLARVSLLHAVLHAHRRVVLTEPAIPKRATVVAEVVLAEEGLAALLQARRARGRGPPSHALEVAPANVVLGARLALVKLVEASADLIELDHLLGAVDILGAALLAAGLFGFLALALAVETARGERSFELRKLRGGHCGCGSVM